MNKKLLICGAIATTLFLTACVKKEEPQTEQPEVAEVTVEQVATPAEFEALESVESSQSEVVIVETQVTEITNTAPEARREVRVVTEAEPTAAVAKPKAAPVQDTETQYAPKPTTSSQSQDDAVNDAIAAAMPALEN